ncbi:hypothetical protein ACFLUE_02885 [Chloroflexota bacterium]
MPYVRVEASNTIAGVVRLQWSRLYTGAEDDYFHGVTMPADGSLIRVRISLPADSRKLYRQRVTGLALSYNPAGREYEQSLSMGAV